MSIIPNLTPGLDKALSRIDEVIRKAEAVVDDPPWLTDKAVLAAWAGNLRMARDYRATLGSSKARAETDAVYRKKWLGTASALLSQVSQILADAGEQGVLNNARAALAEAAAVVITTSLEVVGTAAEQVAKTTAPVFGALLKSPVVWVAALGAGAWFIGLPLLRRRVARRGLSGCLCSAVGPERDDEE